MYAYSLFMYACMYVCTFVVSNLHIDQLLMIFQQEKKLIINIEILVFLLVTKACRLIIKLSNLLLYSYFTVYSFYACNKCKLFI